MMRFCRALLFAAAAACLLVPEASFAATSYKQKVQRTRITVHARPRHWHGYGFLPGYRPWVNGLDRSGRVVERPERPEPRYFDFYGNVRYGWGSPGFYRGRWNGGSFGPCYAYTPIGMMPTCGN
jgi:hypothetical protein